MSNDGILSDGAICASVAKLTLKPILSFLFHKLSDSFEVIINIRNNYWTTGHVILIDVILEIMSFDGRVCTELALIGFLFCVPNHMLFECRSLHCFILALIAFVGLVSSV